MKKPQDLEKYLKNSKIHLIYKERENLLYSYSEKDKKELKKIENKYPINYDILLGAVNVLPNTWSSVKQNIVKQLDKYMEKQNLIGAYENEKFYKTGFRDGALMMLEILQKKK